MTFEPSALFSLVQLTNCWVFLSIRGIFRSGSGQIYCPSLNVLQSSLTGGTVDTNGTVGANSTNEIYNEHLKTFILIDFYILERYKVGEQCH